MNIRPEYPRPQFKRTNWINLNGTWDFEFDNGLSGVDRGLQNRNALASKITVPFCVESKLSGIGNTDFNRGVWYKKIISLPDDWQECGRRTHLNIGACDYETSVFVNGKLCEKHYGGYTPICVDITSALKKGENDISIFAKDDMINPQTIIGPRGPSGKQSEQYNSYGCFYTRTTGIWQTVWLENTPNEYIKSVKLTPSLANGTLYIEANLENADGVELSATASFSSKVVGTAKSIVTWKKAYLKIDLSEIHPWNTDTPDLYDLELCLGNDKVQSYFGLRDITFKNNVTYINGEPVFQRLILDQGFYPDGIYTAPSEQELINDIKRSMDMGFNGARLHQKIFEPLFLYHCDKMGYLVWDEHANWGMDVTSYSCYEAFLSEWLEILQRDYNHPSIIGWCPLNETQKGTNPRFVNYIYSLTKDYDPTRLFIDCSGWEHIDGCYDMLDVHDYCANPKEFNEKYLPLINGEPAECAKYHPGEYQNALTKSKDICFVSEFGGISLSDKIDGGFKDVGDWGYSNDSDESAFLKRYKGLVDALLDNPKITAFCYTQLTDVEQEQNGLYTYDRKPKIDPEKIKAITSRKSAIEK